MQFLGVMLLFLFVFTSVADAQVINEVFPNPSGDEKTEEWIEIYNPTDNAIDLSGYVLEDAASHQLLLDAEVVGGKTIIESKGYIVIKGYGKELPLNNSDEIINFYKTQEKEELLDSFSYNKTKEGFSLGRVPDGADVNGNMLDSSPGSANNPPPAPTPTKTPTPTKKPKPTQTPKPTNTPIPTPTPIDKITKTNQSTELTAYESSQKNHESKSIDPKDVVLGTSEASDDEDQDGLEDDVNSEQKLPVAAITFVIGGISFLGAGSYPFLKRYLDSRNKKNSKIKKDEKIEL